MIWWLIYISVFIVSGLIGYGVTTYNPAITDELIRRIAEQVGSIELTTLGIFLHNLKANLLPLLPYILLLPIVRGRRIRIILALIPLLSVILNGAIIGSVYSYLLNNPAISKVLYTACGSNAYVIPLALILPHGIPEVLGLTAIASTPLTIEFGDEKRYSKALVKVLLGVGLLLAAAYIEANLTLRVATKAISIFCEESLITDIIKNLNP
jgi:uncharacterized membrane protein SpoIIM required for sporulation